MAAPVNFDNGQIDEILVDWLDALREQAVDAIVVLGPNPRVEEDLRMVVAVHPPRLQEAANVLAQSADFGKPWRESEAPLVVWQSLAKAAFLSENRWRRIWLGLGYQTVVRVEFSLPGDRAFECFLFSPREMHERTEAALLAWSTLNIWPLLKRAIAQAQSPLSPRERECLSLAFEGLTAQDSAQRMGLSVRTVTYHLANAMRKLKVDNKLAAVRRACWFGAI